MKYFLLLAGFISSLAALGQKPTATNLWQQGQKQYDQKDYSKALALFNQALKLDTTQAQIYESQGKTLLQLKNFDQAITSYNRAIMLKANWADAYFGRGFACFKKKQYNQAMQDLNKAIALNAQVADYYHARGYVRYENKFYKMALQDFEQAIALDAKVGNYYNSRGMAKVALNEADSAMQDFIKANELNPELANPLYNAGLLLYAAALAEANGRTQRANAALKLFEEAIKKNDQKIDHYLAKAATYEMLHKPAKAKETYEQAHSLAMAYPVKYADKLRLIKQKLHNSTANTDCRISNKGFDELQNALSKLTFNRDKIAYLKGFLGSRKKCYTLPQLKVITRQLNFPKDQMNFLDFAYDYAYKTSNYYYAFQDFFSFPADKKAFSEIIDEKRKAAKASQNDTANTCLINYRDFKQLKERLNETSFNTQKMTLLKSFFRSKKKCFTLSQLKILVRDLTFPDDMMDFLDFAYGYVQTTKNYYYTFEDLFPIPSDKKTFRELVIEKEKNR